MSRSEESPTGKAGFDPQSGTHEDCLAGLVVKESTSGAEDPGFESRLRWDFSESRLTSDLLLALQWLPCQAPGIIGSTHEKIGPVSVYCDWVR